MSCPCDVADGAAEFPDNIACVLVSGFGSTAPSKKKYLGHKTGLLDKPTITIKVFIETALDAAFFLEWWVVELDYNTKPFIIDLPYFGIRKKWTASIIGQMPESLVTGEVRDVKLKLKIHDDLLEAIQNHKCEV